MNEEILKNLESLGYTQYESKVFYALFTGDNMTTTEIAKAAGIPRSSAYEILKSFTHKGICNEIETSSVVRYQLIDPKVISDKIENDIQKSFKDKLKYLKQSFETLEPLYRNKEEKGEKVDVELIRGFNRHRNMKFLNLLKYAEEEVLLMIKLEGNVSESLNEAAKDLYSKGGVIRSIYEASYDFKVNFNGDWKKVGSDGLLKICKGFEKQGEQIRISEKVFQNMAVFDRKTVFVSLVDPSLPKHKRSDVIVKNENYASSMAEYFASVWDKSFTTEEFEKRTGTKN
jgi:sugar-specific transcriptional regulator TrmB